MPNQDNNKKEAKKSGLMIRFSFGTQEKEPQRKERTWMHRYQYENRGEIGPKIRIE